MATRRKLFLTHAGELAHLLVRDVERDGLVARFVRAYAERHGRRGLLNDPARLPELESTIGREALLVMAADLRQQLVQEFRVGRSSALRPDEATFVNAFYAEFLAALIRALGWSQPSAATESELFRRDLEMYRRWGDRPTPLAGVARADENCSPFRDRSALLLDPAMMEQARRAAAEFEKEILLTAARRFRQLGRSVVAKRAARHQKKKSAERRKKPIHRLKKSRSGAKRTPQHHPSSSSRRKPKSSSRTRLARR